MQGDRRRHPAGARPHRRPRQQRRRPVPGAARRHLAEGLGDRGAHQPHRRLPDGARVLHAVDARARRRDRQHRRRHVERHAGHGPLRRGARRHGQLHRDGGAANGRASGVRVNAVAPGWIASSGIDTYPGRRASHAALAAQGPRAAAAASAPRPRSRRHRLPAVAGRGFISGDTLRVDGAAPNASDRPYPHAAHHAPVHSALTTASTGP